MANIIKDKFAISDREPTSVPMPKQSKGLWARTLIRASHDDVEYDQNGIAHFVKKIPTGKDSFGNTMFRTEKAEELWSTSNMVPIGGCQFAMELMFGEKSTQFSVPTLYDESGIGLANSGVPTTTFDVPTGTKTITYNMGTLIQLYGVGITGTAENDVTVHPVDYRENSININRVTTDGLTLTGHMIPFRYTAEELNQEDRYLYFGKKREASGEIGYYLKRFENPAVIKHIWKTGEDVEDEALVSSADVWSNNVGSNAIESFAECVIKISKKDIKEWFIAQGQEDRARINTIALFTGQYVKNADGSLGDYRDVRMFSKLNIPTEYLSLTKDLNLIYRVYTA